MLITRVLAISLIILLLPVQALADQECQGSKEGIGTVVGALLGGILGSNVGKGSGKKVATVLGAVAGGYAGNRYGESLDCADQQRHQKAALTAFESQPTGQSSSWKNPDTGAQGSITPVRTWQREGGQYCRDYTQSIVIDGKVEKANGTACREDGGSWRIVSNQQPAQTPDYSGSNNQEQQF